MFSLFQDNAVCTATEKSIPAEPEPELKPESEPDEKPEEESDSSGGTESDEDSIRKSKKKKKKEKKKKKKKQKKEKKEKDFESEVAEAMKKQDADERSAERLLDDRKRSYNNVLGFEAKAPTEAEMEAFYRKRKREDDPMLQFMK